MSKYIPLGKACKYSSEKIKLDELTLGSYITTDNILQNKQGVTIATNLPPQGNNFPKYNAGNILVGNIRPYLKKIWFADNDGGCSADVLVFDVKKGFFPKFVYYAIFQDDFFVHTMKGSKGTKMPRGDKNQIMEYQIPDIDFNSQKQIANVLSALDSKIVLNNRINAELEAMAKTVYDYWFVQFDFPNEKGKPYKSSGGKMVWSEELKREVPEGWEVKSLGGYAEIKRGELITAKDTKIGNVKVVAAGVDYSYTHSKSNRESNTITISGSGANAGYINFWREPIFASDCITVRANSDTETLILLQFLKAHQLHILNQAKGSAQPHVYPSDIKILNFTIPSKEVFELYGKIAIPLNKKIANNEQENQQLSSLRDWLLPMLMNGQVSVNVQEEMEVERLMVTEAEYKSKNAQLDYYHKIESVYVILWANKLLGVQQGEMALAKDTYMVDKLAGIDTGFTFAQHNWGSYDPTFKKTINNKQYFVRRNFENSQAKYFDLNDNEKLLTRIPETTKEAVRKTVEELHKKVFYKYQWSKKAEMKELYATVLKCIEDTQSIDMTVIRQAMKDWKTPKQDFPNKAAKFSEQLTKEALDMIVKEGWDLKVRKDKTQKNIMK